MFSPDDMALIVLQWFHRRYGGAWLHPMYPSGSSVWKVPMVFPVATYRISLEQAGIEFIGTPDDRPGIVGKCPETPGCL